MASYQVVCINKPNRLSPYEHILDVGILNPRVLLKVDDVIRHIESNTHSFYTKDAVGNIAFIGVVKATAHNRKHIRTYADGKWTDNLLSLDQCPIQ